MEPAETLSWRGESQQTSHVYGEPEARRPHTRVDLSHVVGPFESQRC